MARKADPRETRLPVPRGELPPFTPVPRKCARHDGWTARRQRRFIEALADTGSVSSACRRVNRAEVGAYLLRRHPEAGEFRRAWQTALDLGMQRIEDVAMDRALNGVEVPVYSYGKLVGTRTVHNDRLLMFMLRNRAPERFAEGKPKGMNAIGKMEMERLKKQWRKEWEAERAATACEREDAVIEDINEKLSKMRTRRLAMMSPRTRAAHDTFERLIREDEEAGYRPWDDPEHPYYVEPDADWPDGEEEDAPVDAAGMVFNGAMLPPPDEESTQEDEPDPPGTPRWRSIRDDGWE